MADFPSDGMAVTVLLVVSGLERSVAFYRDVLGATLYREYGGTSAVFSTRTEPFSAEIKAKSMSPSDRLLSFPRSS